MPYFQDGKHIYWWDTGARQRRTAAADINTNTAPSNRRHPSDAAAPRDPDPHHIRDTTVRGPTATG